MSFYNRLFYDIFVQTGDVLWSNINQTLYPATIITITERKIYNPSLSGEAIANVFNTHFSNVVFIENFDPNKEQYSSSIACISESVFVSPDHRQ